MGGNMKIIRSTFPKQKNTSLIQESSRKACLIHLTLIMKTTIAGHRVRSNVFFVKADLKLAKWS